MQGTGSLCAQPHGMLSFYRDKDLLFSMQGTLLPDRYEGKNPGGHAVFRDEVIFPASGHGLPAYDRNEKGREKLI